MTPAETAALIRPARAPTWTTPTARARCAIEAAAALEATLPRTAAGADVLARLLLSLFPVDELRRPCVPACRGTFGRLPAGTVAGRLPSTPSRPLEAGEVDRLFAVHRGAAAPSRRDPAVQQAVRAGAGGRVTALRVGDVVGWADALDGRWCASKAALCARFGTRCLSAP